MINVPAIPIDLIDDELARRSLKEFVRVTHQGFDFNWHHDLLCDVLQDVIEGRKKRVIISLPPRHGKTEIASKKAPAWAFGRFPNIRFLAASYSADLSQMINRDVQKIMDSSRYQRIFPATTLNGSSVRSSAEGKALRNSDIFEIVGHKGMYRSAGVGGGITGMGGDILLVDDPFKNIEEAESKTIRDAVDEWYRTTFYTRQEKDAAIIIIMTRWHEDDLVGRLLQRERSPEDGVEPEGWEVIEIPGIAHEDESIELNPRDPRQRGDALWSNKYPIKKLRQIKGALGARHFSALYQQRPTVPDGSIFKRSHFKFYKELPQRLDIEILSLDCAFKDSKDSDYVCIGHMAQKGADFYLTDVVRKKLGFTETQSVVKTMSGKHPNAFTKVVEDKANGPAIIESLKRDIPGLVAYDPKTNKSARAWAVSGVFESGNFWLPDPTMFDVPWVHAFIEEMVSFGPGCAHDDQVDMVTQALLRLRGSGTDLLKNMTKM